MSDTDVRLCHPGGGPISGRPATPPETRPLSSIAYGIRRLCDESVPRDERYPPMTDDLCPFCRRPMPEAKPTGRRRVWCGDACRKAARGRSPAELEANRRHLAEVNARLSASLRGIR